MKIFIACPAPAQSLKGNRVTAVRWARQLRLLGHSVSIGEEHAGGSFDLLVALHAKKSHRAICAFRRHLPAAPIILALTGTDLYRDIHRSARACESLEIADRLIVLQACGADSLPMRHRKKVRVIRQSADAIGPGRVRTAKWFDACVLGHLRIEKDPFRAALALRLLSDDSRIRVLHAGEALDAVHARRARRLMAVEPRYHWLGELSRTRARRLLARCKLLILSSRMEGGANVISEAIVEGVPVLASRIAGTVGLLGEGYAGYFPVGDTAALARLLLHSETNPVFYQRLQNHIRHLSPQFTPECELQAWRDLLSEPFKEPVPL